MGSPSLRAAVTHINNLAAKYGIHDFVPECRVQEYEDARAKFRAQADERRFWGYIIFEDDNTCWKWGAALTRGGYGITRSLGKNALAHRYSYELHKGKIPDGLVIDHRCRTRHCVNPAHLEAVTIATNNNRGLRGRGKGGRFCGRGHEYTPENTYYETTNRGYPRRNCKACRRVRYREKKQEIVCERV